MPCSNSPQCQWDPQEGKEERPQRTTSWRRGWSGSLATTHRKPTLNTRRKQRRAHKKPTQRASTVNDFMASRMGGSLATRQRKPTLNTQKTLQWNCIVQHLVLNVICPSVSRPHDKSKFIDYVSCTLNVISDVSPTSDFPVHV